MSFKVHLLIVTLIIIGMYFITQFFLVKPAATDTIQITPSSPYNITIERASWGLNCRMPAKNVDDSYMQYGSSSTAKVSDNNVLYNVSRICNGKSNCDIPIDPNYLGEDPLPTCMYKLLHVEYRCYSVDRLHTLKAREGVLSIDCDKQFANQ